MLLADRHELKEGSNVIATHAHGLLESIEHADHWENQETFGGTHGPAKEGREKPLKAPKIIQYGWFLMILIPRCCARGRRSLMVFDHDG